MSNPIDDATFEAAWNDLDNTRMMRKTAAPYRRHMSDEEWLQLQRIGLMNTLKSHDYTGRRKFITSLRLRTLWVFKTHARGAFRKSRLNAKMLTDPPRPVQDPGGCSRIDLEDSVRSLLDELSPEERVVVTAMHVENMSLIEISRRTGIPRARVDALHQSGMFKLRYLAKDHDGD
jgi:RNA polymerase sigma factor (sigma-70 family)